MITKFNKIRQTMDYKRYELKEKRGIGWVNLDKNKALTGIQKLFKATITDEQSAFKNYTNSFAISNIKVRGIKALQYLKFQDVKIKEYISPETQGNETSFGNLQHLQEQEEKRRGETHSQE